MKAYVEPREKMQGGIGVFISVIGWLIIALGVVVGVYLGMHGNVVIAEIDKGGFAWTIAAICWVVGIVLGLVLIGIGNIVEVLVEIGNREFVVKVEENGGYGKGNEGKYFGQYNRESVRRDVTQGNGTAFENAAGEVRRRRRSEGNFGG